MNEFFIRQMDLIGEDCQKQLSESAILIAGLGGLGGLAAELSVRAGIGKLYIIDDGFIDEPDLNRQILYTAADLGKRKIDMGLEKLKNIGLPTEIIPIYGRIDKSFKLPDDIDGIIDCLDNFRARYIIDELANKKNIFFVHGAINGWFGQISSIVSGKTKRLKEIFPNMKDSNAIIPVMGFTPSVMASIQISEAVKLICGIKNNLMNKILFIDLKNYSFDIVELS
jgi:molybdopterin/thiamine biosynthesis adenylyltransferase